MKNLFIYMLLIAAPMLVQALDADRLETRSDIIIHDQNRRHDDRRDVSGYFWSDDTQYLRGGITGSSGIVTLGDAVVWSNQESLHTDGLFVSSSNATVIVIEDPGLYQLDYLVNGMSFAVHFQFATYLNGQIVEGSTYGAKVLETSGATFSTEVSGQLFVKIIEKFSELRLVNQSETKVALYNNYGTTDTKDFGFNVTASMIIKKVGDVGGHRGDR